MINIATTRIHSVEGDFMSERSLDRGWLMDRERAIGLIAIIVESLVVFCIDTML